jgi:hypothetical protein
MNNCFTTPLDSELFSLKKIQRATFFLAALAVSGALFLRPTFSFVGGVLLGAALGVANFQFLYKLVKNMLVSHSSYTRGMLGFLFLLKMIFIFCDKQKT